MLQVEVTTQAETRLRMAVLRLKSALAAAEVVAAGARVLVLLGKANFDPTQPRVPRGGPDGGQWTRVEGWRSGQTVQVAGPISPELEQECLRQYERDTFHCTMVGSAACHAQAAERYAACLRGRPIPPLSY